MKVVKKRGHICFVEADGLKSVIIDNVFRSMKEESQFFPTILEASHPLGYLQPYLLDNLYANLHT